MANRLDTRDNIQNLPHHEDWQNWHGNYHYHNGWHHGCWHGNWGNWWHHMWNDHTALMAFGVTMWGINRVAYGFGYWDYYNPYYGGTSYGSAGDYSQPLVVESVPEPAPQDASAPPPPGYAEFDAARQAFYAVDYDKALAETNKALASLPNDPVVHEFRALVLFAQRKYQESAAVLNSVLSVGPGWDWTTMQSLYPSQKIYAEQLAALEAFVKQNPEATYGHFVLGYHYLTAGKADEAAAQYKIVVEQQPKDRVAQELLVNLKGPEALPGGAPATAQTTDADAPTIPAEQLLGRWSAANAAGSKFDLTLDKEGNFTWTYTEGGKSQSVKGVFALDKSTLAMEPDAGGVMLAQLTPPQDGRFKFTMLGNPTDPGLEFKKVQ